MLQEYSQFHSMSSVCVAKKYVERCIELAKDSDEPVRVDISHLLVQVWRSYAETPQADKLMIEFGDGIIYELPAETLLYKYDGKSIENVRPVVLVTPRPCRVLHT